MQLIIDIKNSTFLNNNFISRCKDLIICKSLIVY